MPRALQKTNEKKKKKQFKVSFHRWTHFSHHLLILIYSLIYQRTENIVWYLAEQWVDNCHMYTSHTPDNIHSSCDFEEPQGLHSAALLRCSSYFFQVPESVVQTTVSGNGWLPIFSRLFCSIFSRFFCSIFSRSFSTTHVAKGHVTQVI